MRGRPRYGDPEKEKVIKFSTSLPPDMYARLEAYCKAEEREKSFAIRKALEVWLKDRGY
jgi:predicted DNA-binding protein